jgi:hypothetical protein
MSLFLVFGEPLVFRLISTSAKAEFILVQYPVTRMRKMIPPSIGCAMLLVFLVLRQSKADT